MQGGQRPVPEVPEPGLGLQQVGLAGDARVPRVESKHKGDTLITCSCHICLAKEGEGHTVEFQGQ